jgi:hypothetical protein
MRTFRITKECVAIVSVDFKKCLYEIFGVSAYARPRKNQTPDINTYTQTNFSPCAFYGPMAL